MRIALLSDSPTLTTGFGVTASRIAQTLRDAEHDVACFGFKARENSWDASQYGYRIWAAGGGDNWPRVLPEFFAREKPQAVLLNMDIFNAREVLDHCQRAGWQGPTIAYLMLDGLPAYRQYLDALREISAFLITTQTGVEYMRGCGFSRLFLAPPGVEARVFRSLPNARQLREMVGLHDKFMVGVFGRNTERKQQARVLLALAKLRRAGRDSNIFVYFHCNPRGYWHLDEIAQDLGVLDRVLFAGSGSFDETMGVPCESKSAVVNYGVFRF
ncbi:hypothetical protein [Pseudomonas sp.]|uniref:hypothetical protein n=1 Tax=Pseudomonas sp. TaxID=306 RepID=UPI00272C8B0C|nr:hypothetical protein [Pseudomonas sp.]